MSEHDTQVALLRWLRVQHPKVWDLTYATPNAGKRSVRTGARMKAEGLRAGVPDLCIAVPVEPFHGLYIELKTEKGRPTPAQREWIEKLDSVGYMAKVCYGFDEAKKTISDYLGA